MYIAVERTVTGALEERLNVLRLHLLSFTSSKLQVAVATPSNRITLYPCDPPPPPARTPLVRMANAVRIPNAKMPPITHAKG